MTKPLEGRIALVAGATRGAGRGIAAMLGEAGATVYCSGRSTAAEPATPGRPETIEETAERVTTLGGHGIARRVDHTQADQVATLCDEIARDQGRLDLLVNDVWGGDRFIEWEAKFWTGDPGVLRPLVDQAVYSHLLTARYAAPLMIQQKSGLIVEVTDGSLSGYRGQILYNLVKSAVSRLAYAMAWDLKDTGVTALAVSPGFLRSEAMLDGFGVTEANWRDAIARDPLFAESETPGYIGRAVARLAADPQVHRKAGAVFFAADLAEEYGFTDLDGRQPHFWRHVETLLAAAPDSEQRRALMLHRYQPIHREPDRAAQAGRYLDALALGDLGCGLAPILSATPPSH